MKRPKISLILLILSTASYTYSLLCMKKTKSKKYFTGKRRDLQEHMGQNCKSLESLKKFHQRQRKKRGSIIPNWDFDPLMRYMQNDILKKVD